VQSAIRTVKNQETALAGRYTQEVRCPGLRTACGWLFTAKVKMLRSRPDSASIRARWEGAVGTLVAKGTSWVTGRRKSSRGGAEWEGVAGKY
jgi:hypothetical protein